MMFQIQIKLCIFRNCFNICKIEMVSEGFIYASIKEEKQNYVIGEKLKLNIRIGLGGGYSHLSNPVILHNDHYNFNSRSNRITSNLYS